MFEKFFKVVVEDHRGRAPSPVVLLGAVGNNGCPAVGLSWEVLPSGQKLPVWRFRTRKGWGLRRFAYRGGGGTTFLCSDKELKELLAFLPDGWEEAFHIPIEWQSGRQPVHGLSSGAVALDGNLLVSATSVADAIFSFFPPSKDGGLHPGLEWVEGDEVTAAS